MINVLSVPVLLLAIINSGFFGTPSRQQNRDQSVSHTLSSKWIKVSTPAAEVFPKLAATAIFQELTFSANGDLYALVIMGLMRSTDNGRSWTKINVKTPDPYKTLTCVTVTEDGVIYVGAKSTSYGNGSIILRSADGGKSWTHTKLTPKDADDDLSYEIESLAVSSNGDFWAGADFGTFFRSTDKGKTWTAVGKVEGFETVAAITFGLDGQLYAAIAKTGIFHSTDGGRTWKETGFGKNSVDSVAVNKKGHLFAGTLKRGVLRSTDGGQTWTSINDGLPVPNVPALALDKDGYLYAGTWANGLFRSAHSTIDDRAFVSD